MKAELHIIETKIFKPFRVNFTIENLGDLKFFTEYFVEPHPHKKHPVLQNMFDELQAKLFYYQTP